MCVCVLVIVWVFGNCGGVLVIVLVFRLNVCECFGNCVGVW